MTSNSFSFQTTTYGKWILAGEHSVLRGHPALVFPLMARQFGLQFIENDHAWSVITQGSKDSILEPLVLRLLAYAQEVVLPHRTLPLGQFKLRNTIPLGSGMGASAALCVAVAQWLQACDLIQSKEILNIAQQLENLFHGKSSGLDIAGVASVQPQYFLNHQTQPITMSWQPLWCLSDTGSQGLTSPCISKVQALWKKNPHIAQSIDEDMHQSVELAHQALTSQDSQRLSWLIESMNLACDCFNAWGLMTPNIQHHIQQLKSQGALAVKPTGSGGGGYLLSLWEHSIPTQHASEIIALTSDV